MIGKFTYTRANTVQQAIKLLAGSGTMPYAGGTDLLGLMRDGVVTFEKAISLSGLPELRGIKATSDGGLSIGALTTLTEIAEHPQVVQQYAVLAQGAESAASPQLRNQGTLGGNLCQRPRCWYFRGAYNCLRKGGVQCYAVTGRNDFHAILGGDRCFIVHPSDTAPALVALDARVSITGPKGSRIIPVETFFVGPEKDIRKENVLNQGELVTEVVLPPPGPGHRSSYRKVRARGAWDFALVGVALSLVFKDDRIEHARVVLSGVAPIPWRSAEVEKLLEGQRIDEDLARRAGEASVKDAQPLSQNEYKIHLASGAIQDALLAL